MTSHDNEPSLFDTNFNDEPHAATAPTDTDGEQSASQATFVGNPGLPLASLIFGIAALILEVFVNWIAGTIGGIIAICMAVAALRQKSPWPVISKIGMALGILAIVASLGVVGYALYQLASVGLLF